MQLANVVNLGLHMDMWSDMMLERVDKFCYIGDMLDVDGGTRCRSLFVTHLWQWHSSAHILRLFYFAEHIILSIASSWQFRL